MSACAPADTRVPDSDESWNEITRALRADPSRLDGIAPRLAFDIRRTASIGEPPLRYVDLWGQSSNVDASQLALPHPTPTVDEATLDAINARAGMPGARHGTVTFAGIEHTYGYLLSDLPTPFGFKRARWIKDDVEVGFGLPNGSLWPIPTAGTLFANVTFFAGNIAFRDDANERAALGAGGRAVHPGMYAFDFASLKRTRIEEKAVLGERTITMRTDYVAFTKRVVAPDGNTDFLVYSIHDSADGRARLISMFPVLPASRQKALDPARFGDAQELSPQFNAVVLGFTTPVSGSRRRFD